MVVDHVGDMSNATELPPVSHSYDISSERELQRELSRLFQSAYRNDVPIGPTWTCEYMNRPNLEVIATELAENRES